jgi:ABC-type multidrug transport system fused ATPase/permease subunit
MSAMAEPGAVRPAEVDDRSVGDLVSEAVSDITRLVKYETDLAKQELLADVRRIGMSAGLAATILVTSFLMLVMLCFALAYGLQTLGVWDWASFLIVAGVLVVLAAAFAGVIYLLVRRLDRLRKTRETVQSDIAMLRHDEQTGPPAAIPR